MESDPEWAIMSRFQLGLLFIEDRISEEAGLRHWLSLNTNLVIEILEHAIFDFFGYRIEWQVVLP